MVKCPFCGWVGQEFLSCGLKPRKNARCPKCGKVANNRTEVNEKFGIRNDAGYVKVQSWCKVCR